MLKKNSLHTVTVTDLNNLGYGVARLEGMVVFIDGALPGEEAEIKLIKVARDYAVGRVEHLIASSPDRIPSDCSVSNRCGGCSFRTLRPEAELNCKHRYVTQAFRKTGLENVSVLPVLASPREDGYRNKVLYPVDEQMRFGYYARHSHTVIPCSDCKLQSPLLTPIVKDLEAFFIEHRPDNLRNLYLRVAEGTNQVLVAPVLSSAYAPWTDSLVEMLIRRHPAVKTVLLNINPTEGNVVLGKENRLIYGDGYLEDLLCGLRFRISPLSFYQVNRLGAEILYEEAIRRASDSHPERVADLYCGTGTIGLILASRLPSCQLKGVEIVPDAVENARHNAKINGIANAVFLCADSVGAEVHGMDCVILDPPRKGSTPALLERIAADRVGRIVYVSCNPDTLARDAALLVRLGYEMGTVQPVDLFPRTGSIECVTDFTLKGET